MAQIRMHQKFGAWTSLVEGEYTTTARIKVQCQCGSIRDNLVASLVYGKSNMCGSCSSRVSAAERARKKPVENLCDMSLLRLFPSEYKSWSSMKNRCHGKNSHKDYGGRGITVCERWRNSFLDFLRDVGPKPSSGLSLDRIDVNGNYEPGNCRWATAKQQMRNTRRAILVEVGGRKVPLMDACEGDLLAYRRQYRKIKPALTLGKYRELVKFARVLSRIASRST